MVHDLKTHTVKYASGGEFKKYYGPIYFYTAVFGLMFIVGPFLVKNRPDKAILRCCIMMAAFCMWLFWITMYIAQMNPLMGPRVSNHTLIWIAHHWGDPLTKSEPAREDD